jgi:hypothetical protein
LAFLSPEFGNPRSEPHYSPTCRSPDLTILY